MQRTLSFTGREYELVSRALHFTGLHLPEAYSKQEPLTSDEHKMLIEEHARLLAKLTAAADTPIGGVFIDGARM